MKLYGIHELKEKIREVFFSDFLDLKLPFFKFIERIFHQRNKC